MCTLLVSLPTPALTTWLRTGCACFQHARGCCMDVANLHDIGTYRSRYDIPPTSYLLQSAGPRKGESGSDPQVQDNILMRHFARISASYI